MGQAKGLDHTAGPWASEMVLRYVRPRLPHPNVLMELIPWYQEAPAVKSIATGCQDFGDPLRQEKKSIVYLTESFACVLRDARSMSGGPNWYVPGCGPRLFSVRTG